MNEQLSLVYFFLPYLKLLHMSYIGVMDWKV